MIGGSIREERYDVLVEKIKDKGLNPDDYQFYLDLRKYGTIPHGGFGLGFERLVMIVTSIDNIMNYYYMCIRIIYQFYFIFKF